MATPLIEPSRFMVRLPRALWLVLVLSACVSHLSEMSMADEKSPQKEEYAKQSALLEPSKAEVCDDQLEEAQPPSPTKTREIIVRVVDLAAQPVRNAFVRLRDRLVFVRELDRLTTDEQGVAR